MEQSQVFLNIKQEDLEVHDWLGNGGSGEVFQGIWRNGGEQFTVAIKKMRLNGKEAVDDICKELKAVQSVRSEHICKTYGWCLFDNYEVWLVMEFVDGGDLHNYLTKYGKPLPKDLQLSFFIQATKALHSLHTAHTPLLHKDIKSLNFLVSLSGFATKLLVTDFGLSKAKPHVHANSYTVSTVRWAAPEIVSSQNPQWSEKTDIYSLGMVFFEILSQALPYQEESHLTSILKKIKSGVPPKLPADCPREFAGIINECLHPKPGRRPSTAEILAMLEDLAHPQVIKQMPIGKAPSLGSSGDLSIDFDLVRQRCAESIIAGQDFNGVQPEPLLDIFCIANDIPNDFRAAPICANLRTVIWWLINHDEDIMMTKAFLHAPTTLATPTLILQNLLELLRAKIDQTPEVPKKVVAFTKVWIEDLFSRDFHKDSIASLFALIRELEKMDLQFEANILKLTFIRVNKNKLVDKSKRTVTPPVVQAPVRKLRGFSAGSKTIPRPGFLKEALNSKLIDMNVMDVAEQFTLIELNMFKAIELLEVSNMAWKSDAPRKTAPNVINILTRFDLVCQWASTEVVMAQSPKQRVLVTEKLILLAQKCLELRNYNSVFEIMAGLHRPSVRRMKSTWEAISTSCQTIFKALMEVVDVCNNYKTYREHLKKSILPCLPFVGVFLRDLTFEAEHPGTDGENINFEKIYKNSRIFKEIQTFQQSTYALEDDESLQPTLRRLLAMPEELLYKHSQTIDPVPTPPGSPPNSPPISKSPRLLRKTSAASSSVPLLFGFKAQLQDGFSFSTSK